MTPPRRLIRHEQALNDLEEQASFIAQDSLSAAMRFLAAAERAFTQILEMPGIGASTTYASPRLAGLRRWPIPGFPKHLVFYRYSDGSVKVMRVLHAARDIEAILRDDSMEDDADNTTDG